MSMRAHFELRYALAGFSERWTLSEELVPESAWHDACVELLKALLVSWIARTGRGARVYRNLAVRVRRDRPNVGFDPDLILVEPEPPEGSDLDSLLLWRAEHSPPAIAIEVVSPNHPYKDYREAPEKCALSGIRELVVFDPKLAGPRTGGGPHLLQQWLRQPDGSFLRRHAASTPVRSELIAAWWQPIERMSRLGVSDDAEGLRPWLTLEQMERADKEAARADKEAARADKEAARAESEALRKRVAELEAEIARRR
jgi:Uma2 family endonuclease